MLAHNKGDKIIGFGKFALLPGETGELPEGYNDKHPVVAFYISKGYLAMTTEKAAEKLETEKADAEAQKLAAEKEKADAEAKAEAEKLAAEKAETLKATLEALEGMSLDELKAEADELEITYAGNIGIDALRKRVAEKYQAE